ncbi:hypothetical protein KVQ88_24700, partial [Escherichia coli]|nr:hypothetical protein [Escherichia coli]
QALCRIVVDQYGGDAAAIWTTAATGKELFARLRGLPGFGEQKARIFVALLGTQLGVEPDGGREVAGPYGEDGSRRSAADVTDADTLAELFQYAALSVEMALSRGGDQVVVKNKFNFEFYGGRTKELEKR